MTLADLHWTVGLLEGEGCFTPSRMFLVGGDRRAYCLVQVTSVDIDVLLRLQILWGGRIHKAQQKKPSHTPSHQWRIFGNQARDLIEAIYPYMGERRSAQIEVAAQEIMATGGH